MTTHANVVVLTDMRRRCLRNDCVSEKTFELPINNLHEQFLFHCFLLSMLVPISQCLGYDIFKLVLISGRSCTFAFFFPQRMSWLFLTFDISIFIAEISLSNYRVLLLFWIGTAKLYRLLWERTEDLMKSRTTTKGQRFLSCLNTNTLAWRSWQKTHPWIRDEGLYYSQDSIIVWA